MYTLGRRVDVNESSQKQIKFIETAHDIAISKHYTFSVNVGRSIINKLDVASQVKFLNEKSNHLGLPLPKGTMRIFKRDTDGSLEFLGEDSIAHTPKNENITIRIGNAFDVVATMKLKSLKTVTNGYDAVKRLEINNRGLRSREFDIKLSNYYGDNLQLRQPKHHQLWHRESSTNFTMKFQVRAGRTKIVEWLESVRN